MASAQPAFPSRPYSSALHSSSKLPDRSAPLGFGASSHTHTAREAARQERERQERERAAAAQQATATTSAAASNNMAQLTDEQRDEINEAFSLFDLDKDQLIDYHEFKVALKALGFDLPKPDLLNYLTQHGTPPPPSRAGGQQIASQAPSSQLPSQTSAQAQQQQQQQAAAAAAAVPPSRLHLTLQAFQTIASGLIAARDPREEILRAFALFDTEGKGMITLEDLRRVARELNEGLEEEELVAMIEEFDLEGKGGVGQEEFVGICMG